jgi:hypothetical protein
VNRPITIVSPELAPAVGGLADYTAHLVAHWPRAQEFAFIVPRRAHFAGQLAATYGTVLLQYSAYGYDHLGFPRWLIEALLEWKMKNRGRLCVMFHEIWTFWPWWNKNAPVQWLHRRALARLTRAADVVFTTTASQADHLRLIAPTAEVGVLPVGANIYPEGAMDPRREAGTAVVFGTQGTRIRTLRAMHPTLRELAQTQRLTRLIAVGIDASSQSREDERALLESLAFQHGFEQLGETSAGGISKTLATAEFGIAAQDPLSYTKSGTFMAYAAHGLNILSNYADASAPEPMCLLISPAELKRDVVGEDMTARAQKLRAWYERTASWPQIARTFEAAIS